MVFTLRLTDILLIILTVCACVGVFYAVALMRRTNAMLSDWRRTTAMLDEVLPHVQRLATTSEEAMRSVKDLADKSTRVVTDVVEVTDQIREVAEEGLARLHGIMSAMNAASVLASSFMAGLAAVQTCKQHCEEASNPDDDSLEETEDEKRDL